MSDFFNSFGGIIKGLKPIMDAAGTGNNASMNVIVKQTDMADLENKKKELHVKIGMAILNEESQYPGKYPQFAAEFQQIYLMDQQLATMKAQLDEAQRQFEEQKRAEQAALDERTCPNCENISPEGTKFCTECGTPLGKPKGCFCTQCGAENKPGSRFCGGCGSRIPE